MKNVILLPLLIFSLVSTAALAKRVSLSKKQYEELKKMRNRSKKSKKSLTGFNTPIKKKFNKNITVNRDANTVIKEFMSPNDTMEVNTCFNYPVTFVFDKTFANRVKHLKNNTPGAKVKIDKPKDMPSNGYWATIKVDNSIPVKSRWDGGFTLFVDGYDGNLVGYNFLIKGINCKDGAEFPQEIRISNRDFEMESDHFTLSPQDLIIQESKMYTRSNKYSDVSVYNINPVASSSYQTLFVETVFLNDKKEYFEPTFIVLDALQVQKIDTKFKYIEPSSIKFTNTFDKKYGRAMPRMRWALKVKIDKKYIMEREYIYLMIVDDEDKYYQYMRVPVKKLFLRKIDKDAWSI